MVPEHRLEVKAFSECKKQAVGTVLSTFFLHRTGAELLGTVWRLQSTPMSLSLFSNLDYHHSERDSHVCSTYLVVNMESSPTPLARDRTVSPLAQEPKQILWADPVFPDL